MGSTYRPTIHLRLIGKRVVDFLFLVVLTELFSLVVTAEALRLRLKFNVLQMGGTVSANDSFHTKKLCSRLSSSKMQFETEKGRFAF